MENADPTTIYTIKNTPSNSTSIYNKKYYFIFQTAALVAVTNVSEYLDETAIRRMVLPKTKLVYEKNLNDHKIISNVLSCVEKILDRLDKSQIIDEVLPLLWDVRLTDPEIILRVVSKYTFNPFLVDKKILMQPEIFSYVWSSNFQKIFKTIDSI